MGKRMQLQGFCRVVLRNEARDCYREIDRRGFKCKHKTAGVLLKELENIA